MIDKRPSLIRHLYRRRLLTVAIRKRKDRKIIGTYVPYSDLNAENENPNEPGVHNSTVRSDRAFVISRLNITICKINDVTKYRISTVNTTSCRGRMCIAITPRCFRLVLREWVYRRRDNIFTGTPASTFGTRLWAVLRVAVLRGRINHVTMCGTRGRRDKTWRTLKIGVSKLPPCSPTRVDRWLIWIGGEEKKHFNHEKKSSSLTLSLIFRDENTPTTLSA